ncbi:MAG TPA: hypothetical protein VFY17_02235, partial [Pilimelia sp.]|nr:hypothetical protein [Pilimelia sp.]
GDAADPPTPPGAAAPGPAAGAQDSPARPPHSRDAGAPPDSAPTPPRDPAGAPPTDPATAPPDPTGAATAPPDPTGAAPAAAPVAPPRRRRLGRRAVLLTVATAGVLLCGGGALTYWLVTRETVGEGAADPMAATERFLRAVYQERNAATAADVTCPQVEDRTAVASRVTEVTEALGRYDGAAVSWSAPQLAAGATAERADLTVALTLTTADEREARQNLRVTTVRDGAWYVCEVTAAS